MSRLQTFKLIGLTSIRQCKEQPTNTYCQSNKNKTSHIKNILGVRPGFTKGNKNIDN